MKLGLVIASYGRSDILQQALMRLVSQPRVPDYIIISAVSPADVPVFSQSIANLRTVFGSAGLTRQRNRGLSCLIDTVDVIIFIDDDFIVGDDYFRRMESIFEQEPSIIGVNGHIVADGANSPGFTFEEGFQLLQQYGRQKGPPWLRAIEGSYGCNMAFRSASIGSVRFDERLALYGWQEDSDFCGALRGTGWIVRTNLVWGVHLGTKRGKGSDLRLGYSQIINPAYIVSKGNMSRVYAFRLAAKNVIANLVKSVRPESYVDRRGRLLGNLIGMFHLMTGRLTPEYILNMK
jgi:glycosyltransferase involved in cell wall biosynthesis